MRMRMRKRNGVYLETDSATPMEDLSWDDDLSVTNLDSETAGSLGAMEDPHSQLSLAQQSVSNNRHRNCP